MASLRYSNELGLHEFHVSVFYIQHLRQMFISIFNLFIYSWQGHKIDIQDLSCNPSRKEMDSQQSTSSFAS
ncbi:hypothetical protein KC19_VG119700 [Ceratodon purpureus]|uniref:Uncharacterized protein n=1 Tax=Ceratodon purpureus TaxID=3225 RepID=A0A8T0HQ54_CERPU|nr:hypothetical protein KC19_VG119700 [Ceratodon purpureus]